MIGGLSPNEDPAFVKIVIFQGNDKMIKYDKT